jgi:DNA helicase-2/ATP-dependent DNA helicase PcrA
MINATETEERAHLEEVKRKLAIAIEHVGRRATRYARDARDQKAHIWENKADMDHVEKASARESAEQTSRSGDMAAAAKRRLEKLLQSPYFGRFDFVRDGDVLPVYVGVHAFADDEAKENLVFDWRAPISTMFYDFEIGEARYQSPSGEVRGEIGLKRQFRIRRGQMEFMLESGLNIVDDVLQEELSRTSDDRMKNIVATIQRDQNAIVRNEDAEVLIIQGVAGSGKTSIALHRIAFLLYRFKDTLASTDILILSPNKVFADFISNVLPELGEEPIGEMEMEGLAHELLERKVKFQTYLEQCAALLDGPDEALSRRVAAKASLDFLKALDDYVRHLDEACFRAVDLRVRDHVVVAPLIDLAFRKRPGIAAPERLRWVAEQVEHDAWVQRRYELTAKERAALKAAVRKMYRNASLLTLYKELFAWMGEPALFKTARGGALEYSDVFPLIYLKLRLEGAADRYRHVKHLVIDEMQDYTPVQYAVISRLFSCKKTILGDVNQSLNVGTGATAEAISRVFRASECVKLTKSYRSSYEITQFSQSISPSADLVAIERHGRRPKVIACPTKNEELERILEAASSFPESGFQTMAIICKTHRQAERIHEALRKRVPDAHLLTSRSTAFVRGVVVCAAHLAKGLEFDQVLVPHATDDSYATPLDRNLLYVACTRAMHHLIVTHAGTLSPFVSDSSLYDAA